MLSCGLWCLYGIKTVMCIPPLICLNWTSVPFLSLSMAQCVTRTHTHAHAHTHTHTHTQDEWMFVYLRDYILTLYNKLLPQCVYMKLCLCYDMHTFVCVCVCVCVLYAKCCLFLTLKHKQACGLPQGVVAMLWRKGLSWRALMHPLNVCMHHPLPQNCFPLFRFVFNLW